MKQQLSMMAFNRVEKAWLFAIIIAFFIVGLLYLFSTPPLESSDEYKHYPVVQYIQTQSKLPILDPDDPGLWLQEGAQPPLYYQLMAVISSWIDTSDLNQVHHVNKHAFVGNPNQIRNKNIIIHDREAEQFPWHGTILAIYIIRIASLILSSVTVMVTAYLGKLLMNQKVGLLAATLTAFNPMFLFVSTAVNNDVLANLIGVAGLYALVYLWQNAPHPTQKWWIYAATGGLLGLGILTKLSLGGLLGLAGIVLALQAWQQKRWELFFIAGPIVLGTALLISGWWFVRNVHLYGDLTGLDVFIAVQGTREAPITWAGWIDEFGTFYRSYWGLFGGVNILSPNWLYALYNLFALVGVVGLIKRFLPRRSTVPQTGKGIWILLSWTAVLLLLLIRWNIISPAFQGRLIFPALGGINILLAVGLLAWVKHPMQQRVQKIIAIFLFLLAWIPPWVSIMPAYAHPDVLTAVPPTAQYDTPITFTWEDEVIQLVGVNIDPGQSITAQGEPVKLTLYWQAVTDIKNNYLSTIHLLGRNWESAGSVNRYPGWGMIPTNQWQAGQIWQDDYRVYAHEAAEAPTRLRIKVSLYNTAADTDLPTTINENPLDLVLVGEARLLATTPVQTNISTPMEISFADGIKLNGYTLNQETIESGKPITLELYWQVVGAPTTDYTVFVHLRDLEGNQLAGADAPPLNDDYPTSMWQPEDIIIDPHILFIPELVTPGTYKIAIGLYDPVTGVRVPLQDGGDEVQWQIKVD